MAGHALLYYTLYSLAISSPLSQTELEHNRLGVGLTAIGGQLSLIQHLRVPGPVTGTLEMTFLQRRYYRAHFTGEDAEAKRGEVTATHLQDGGPDCNSGRPGSKVCLSPSHISPNEFSCLTTRSRQGQAWLTSFPLLLCTGFSGLWFNVRQV